MIPFFLGKGEMSERLTVPEPGTVELAWFNPEHFAELGQDAVMAMFFPMGSTSHQDLVGKQ
jgi:hypothetical protein